MGVLPPGITTPMMLVLTISWRIPSKRFVKKIIKNCNFDNNIISGYSTDFDSITVQGFVDFQARIGRALSEGKKCSLRFDHSPN